MIMTTNVRTSDNKEVDIMDYKNACQSLRTGSVTLKEVNLVKEMRKAYKENVAFLLNLNHRYCVKRNLDEFKMVEQLITDEDAKTLHYKNKTRNCLTMTEHLGFLADTQKVLSEEVGTIKPQHEIDYTTQHNRRFWDYYSFMEKAGYAL